MSNVSTDFMQKLEQLSAEDPKRHRKTWQIVSQVSDQDDLGVLMDFAAERGLYETEFAAHLRGENMAAPATSFWRNPIDESEMVWIPPGRFLSGPEDALVELECRGFFLARHPVIHQQFSKFMAETDYSSDTSEHGALLAAENANQNDPVTFVSFDDALAYCDWARMTLSDEWMWEKAARGIDGRLYPWGSMLPIDFLGRNQGYAHVQMSNVSPVGAYGKTRSAYGCEDMVGNVSEWCIRLDEPSNTGIDLVSTADATEASDEVQAVRGSCFLRRANAGMIASHRRRLSRHRRNQWVGFRPAFVP